MEEWWLELASLDFVLKGFGILPHTYYHLGPTTPQLLPPYLLEKKCACGSQWPSPIVGNDGVRLAWWAIGSNLNIHKVIDVFPLVQPSMNICRLASPTRQQPLTILDQPKNFEHPTCLLYPELWSLLRQVCVAIPLRSHYHSSHKCNLGDVDFRGTTVYRQHILPWLSTKMVSHNMF